MARTSAQKARRNAAKKRKKLLKALHTGFAPPPDQSELERRLKRRRRHESKDPILFGPNSSSSSSSSSSSFSLTEGGEEGTSPDVQTLLEPYSKDQIIALLCDAALADPSLHSRILAAADKDISHRKVFVHGLPWDATKEHLLQAFSKYGPVGDCNVVADKATGRGKGYGFVIFNSRSGAVKALKEPDKQIGGRVAHCHLASLGPVSAGGSGGGGGGGGGGGDTVGRKIYITNVPVDADPEKLKSFFAKFGEIETGPMGFDLVTGKSKGYAIFVYRVQEGARKALEQPHKMFEGHRLHCRWASTEPAKVKEVFSTGAAGVLPTAAGLVGAAPQPVLAAVAAAQNLALYSQNPAYGALLGQNPLLAAATGINPATTKPSVLSPVLDGGLGGYGGSSSLLGAYGTQGTAGMQDVQYGLVGSYEGMPSYL